MHKFKENLRYFWVSAHENLGGKNTEVLCTSGSRQLSLHVCGKNKHHAPSDLVLILSSRVIFFPLQTHFNKHSFLFQRTPKTSFTQWKTKNGIHNMTKSQQTCVPHGPETSFSVCSRVSTAMETLAAWHVSQGWVGSTNSGEAPWVMLPSQPWDRSTKYYAAAQLWNHHFVGHGNLKKRSCKAWLFRIPLAIPSEPMTLVVPNLLLLRPKHHYLPQIMDHIDMILIL